MGGTRRCEDWIEGYCKLLETTESPDEYKLWVAISTIAGCLQRKCWLAYHTHVDTYPNMYIVLVGPPGLGKGMAMAPAKEMLDKVKVMMSPNCSTLQALIQNMLAATDSRIIEGVPYISSSLTVFSPEFASFLGRNNGEFCDKLTDLFDCPSSWKYSTIVRGDEDVMGAFLNLIGATTPGLLQATMSGEAITGGLMSRVILVYADKRSRMIPFPMAVSRDMRLRDKLEHDLQQIRDMEGAFKIAPDFVDPWVDWYTTKDVNDPLAADSRLAAYAQRRYMHVLKLIMIMSASRSNEMILRKEDLDRALSVLSEAESKMHIAFRGYGKNVLSAFIAAAQGEIQGAKLIYLKDFKKRHMNDVSAEDIDKVLAALQSVGFCKIFLGERGNEVIKYTGDEG